MKILILTPHYPPRHGGTADYTERFCCELVSRGHQVRAITRDGGPATDPVEVTTLAQSWTLRLLPELLRRIKRDRPDVLLIQYGPWAFNRRGPGVPVALLLIATSWITKLPLVVYGHELYAAWSQSYIRMPWYFAQRVAIGLLVFKSRRFVVTIESRRRRLAQVFPWWRKRIEVIPVTPTLDREKLDVDWRAAKGISEETILLSAMGTDDPSKGAKILGMIAEGLAATGRDFKVVTIGGLKPNHPLVESWGYVSSHDAWNLIAHSDLYVMPYEDGISARRTSALNALAAGTAILTTQGINTDPILFPSESLAMTPAGDARALVNEALALVADPARLIALRHSVGSLAGKFSWQTHVARWEVLLDSVVASS